MPTTKLSIRDVFAQTLIASKLGGDNDLRSMTQQGLLTKLWTFKTPGGESTYSSPIGPVPVRDAEGNLRQAVVFVAADWFVYANDVATGEMIWRFPCGGQCYGRPQAADVDSDGEVEVIAPSHDGYLRCIRSDGDMPTKWQFPSVYIREGAGTVSASGSMYLEAADNDWAQNAFTRPLVNGEPVNNATLSIIDGPAAGQQHVIASVPGGNRLNLVTDWVDGIAPEPGNAFQIIPKWESDHIFMHAGTLVQEGTDWSIYVTSFDNHIYKINATTGQLIWKFATQENIEPYPLVVDIDGDGNLEVLAVSIDEQLRCLDAETGVLKWQRNTGQCDAFLHCLDINNDGVLEIPVSSRDDRIYLIRGTDGERLDQTGAMSAWDYGDLDSSTTPHRVEGEEFPRLYVGGDAGTIWSIDHDLRTQWQNTVVPTAINSSPFFHDVNGDGNAEVLIGDMRGTLYCCDAVTGRIIGREYFKGGIEGVPYYGDIDGDGNVEMIVTTTEGYVECFRFVHGELYQSEFWPKDTKWKGHQHLPVTAGGVVT